MVILTTLFFVCVLVVLVLTVPDQVQMWLDRAKEVIFTEFSWFYVLTFSIFLGFLLILSVSGLGNIRLGRDEDVPEFGFLSWLAMLFAAGMGVGLMFFGVAEPLMHYFFGHYGRRTQAAAGIAAHGVPLGRSRLVGVRYDCIGFGLFRFPLQTAACPAFLFLPPVERKNFRKVRRCH